MENLLKIKLSELEFHLFRGGWKIHHIISDQDFKSQAWGGWAIVKGKKNQTFHSVHSKKIDTQDIEIIPGNPNDIFYFRILIDKKIVVEQRRYSTDGQGLLRELTKNEGLTPYDFHNKKFDLHSRDLKYFSGKIIHFTDFKYHL